MHIIFCFLIINGICQYRGTLSDLLNEAYGQLGNITLHPMITGSGGLTLANHLKVPFVQEVISVATALKELAPRTDVAIELGGEDAKIIYLREAMWNSG